MDPSPNPYTAPQAAPADPSATRPMRRPASVKCLTFILGALSVMLVGLYAQTIAAHGFESVWRSQRSFDISFSIPVCFALLVCGHRSKVFYYAIVGLMTFIAYRLTAQMATQWQAPDAFAGIRVFDRVGELLIAALFCWLFQRVVFGRPSRQYFGIARPQPATGMAESPGQGAVPPALSPAPAAWPPPPDTTPYGKALAECVATRLERGKCVSDYHRDFCGMGLWFINGYYCYDEAWDGRPPDLEYMLAPNPRGGRIFKERSEFVEWFAAQSDHSLAGFEKEPFFHQNSTITRKRLRKHLGCS